MEEKFQEYYDKWVEETAVFSCALQICRNENYVKLVGMGKQIVPLILNELDVNPHMGLFELLYDITGEFPVIAQKDKGYIGKMAKECLKYFENYDGGKV